jgi:hypothetical protein
MAKPTSAPGRITENRPKASIRGRQGPAFSPLFSPSPPAGPRFSNVFNPLASAVPGRAGNIWQHPGNTLAAIGNNRAAAWQQIGRIWRGAGSPLEDAADAGRPQAAATDPRRRFAIYV